MHDVGDSDLESQGYISPHLSPMNAFLQPFRFPSQASSDHVSPKATGIIKVDDFAHELAETLILTEIAAALKLFEATIGEMGVKHSIRGQMSIVPRSTLQYSDNGETLEDYSDLEEEEPGEASPSFLMQDDFAFVDDPELP